MCASWNKKMRTISVGYLRFIAEVWIWKCKLWDFVSPSPATLTPRPYPDYSKLPDFHYLPNAETQVNSWVAWLKLLLSVTNHIILLHNLRTSLGAGHIMRHCLNRRQTKMASVETISASGDISSRFQTLLRGVSDELSPEELRHAVSSIKTNFRGKFEDQGEQDLYSCLQLFAKQGLVSKDNLTLLEGFLSVKASKKKTL